MKLRKISNNSCSFGDYVRGKKGMVGQVASIFVMLLIISVLSGLTFLFVGSMKDQIKTTDSDGENGSAYKAVEKVEDAGSQTINYLGILFLAIIFGVILTVVLRVVIPYLNLGQRLDGF